MMFSTLLLVFGSGIWAPGLQSFSDEVFPEYTITPIEEEWRGDEIPLFSSKAVLLMDLDSMTPVFQHNAYAALPMASLTKMMTAIVITENHSMDEIVTITKSSEFTGGSSMKLKEREQLRLYDLLKGLMMNSGNDAAIALARYDAGTVYGFIEKMNAKADSLFLQNTHFNNPHGLDSENHYSSAFDLAIIAKVLLENSDLQQIVKIQEDTVVSLDGENDHYLKNTNKLLGSIFPVYGIKTGTTGNAGQCLLLFVKANNKEYVLVLLGSEDRYQDAKNILYELLGEL